MDEFFFINQEAPLNLSQSPSVSEGKAESGPTQNCMGEQSMLFLSTQHSQRFPSERNVGSDSSRPLKGTSLKSQDLLDTSHAGSVGLNLYPLYFPKGVELGGQTTLEQPGIDPQVTQNGLFPSLLLSRSPRSAALCPTWDVKQHRSVAI